MSDDIMATNDQAEELESDVHSHYIHGWRPDTGTLNIPLITQVEGNLWQGGCIGGVRLPDDFKYVLSLYPWEQYTLPEGCSRIEVRMYDSGDMPDEGLLRGLANLVIDLSKAGKTLVHCQAGLNRSGLITALALIESGREPEDAIKLLRDQRSSAVLCNQTFANWLLTHA